MSVNIVTGMTGQAHITSDDDRIRNAYYIGNSKYVFEYGHSFEPTILNNNLIRIQDGMLVNQGTQIGIELTDYEDVVIENGLSGVNRNDLIVMRYEKEADTGTESGKLVVIKGTSGATATDPEYISGNILDGGDLIDDMPLYRVRIESLSIVAVEPLFTLYHLPVIATEETIDEMWGSPLPSGSSELVLNVAGYQTTKNTAPIVNFVIEEE